MDKRSRCYDGMRYIRDYTRTALARMAVSMSECGMLLDYASVRSFYDFLTKHVKIVFRDFANKNEAVPLITPPFFLKPLMNVIAGYGVFVPVVYLASEEIREVERVIDEIIQKEMEWAMTIMKVMFFKGRVKDRTSIGGKFALNVIPRDVMADNGFAVTCKKCGIVSSNLTFKEARYIHTYHAFGGHSLLFLVTKNPSPYIDQIMYGF